MLEYAIKKIIDAWTRARTTPRVLFYAASGLAIASLSLQFSFKLETGVSSIFFSSQDTGVNELDTWGLVLAAGLFCIAITWAVVDQVVAHRRDAKRTTIVIESRGLRDENGLSLATEVKRAMRGNVEELVLDLRRFMRDGHVVDAQAAAHEIMRLPGDLRRRRDLRGREEVSIIYGGLTPVPFTFLTGVLLDDEGGITSYDWDRTRERWRPLDDHDDGNRFKRKWQCPRKAVESMVLAISCSYPVLDDNLRRSFPDKPIMRLDLEGGTRESHWSSSKQRALALEVLEVGKEFEKLGV